MDNFRINITAHGLPSFRLAMELGFRQDAPEKKWCKRASHYVIHPKYGLIFLWSDGDRPGQNNPTPIALPYEMKWKQAADMAWEWLTTHAEYPEPKYDWGADVSQGEGWRVYNKEWGFVGPYRYAIVAVKPAWAWYGK